MMTKLESRDSTFDTRLTSVYDVEVIWLRNANPKDDMHSPSKQDVSTKQLASKLGNQGFRPSTAPATASKSRAVSEGDNKVARGKIVREAQALL